MTDQLNDRAWALYYRDNKTLEEIASELGCSVADLRLVPATLQTAVAELMDTSLRGIDKMAEAMGHMRSVMESQDHELGEQAKVMENLTTALDEATGRKKAEAAKMKAKLKKRVKFGRNTNYLQSVRLGLVEGLWNAPLSAIELASDPIKTLIIGLVTTLTFIVFWPISRMFVLVAGLMGLVSPAPKPVEK